jgi:hypothetical protein
LNLACFDIAPAGIANDMGGTRRYFAEVADSFMLSMDDGIFRRT